MFKGKAGRHRSRTRMDRGRLRIESLERRMLLSANLVAIASFSGDDGANPSGGLAHDSSGDFFSTTPGGTIGHGPSYKPPTRPSTATFRSIR